MYKEQASEAPPADDATGAEQAAPDEEEVIDAEYVDVDESG